MNSELTSIKKYNATDAEAKRAELQQQIDDNNQQLILIAKVADLGLCAAFAIPYDRRDEFDGATAENKIRLCLVAIRAARRSSGTFTAAFETEYQNEFNP
jgi:hypothetical protein